jgi:hypothetical protein
MNPNRSLRLAPHNFSKNRQLAIYAPPVFPLWARAIGGFVSGTLEAFAATIIVGLVALILLVTL